jgi:CheY-like chemotaxis protein
MAGISLLVADDSITIQKVIGIIFGSEEYSLTVVDNGKAAVQKAQELLPDVLVIDALMPGMSGYEVCEAIRNDPALSTRPVLLLTGSFEPFDEDRARQCGADDHIVKPFESQQIVAKVQQLFELGQQRAGGGQPVAAAAAPPAETAAPAFTAPDPFEEAPSPFEPTSFDPEPETVSPAEETVFNFQSDNAFEPVTETFAAPLEEPVPARSPDDPWGAFTQEPAPAVASDVPFEAPAEPAPLSFAPEPFVPPQEEAFEPPAVERNEQQVGASWVPVEEQTFEFRDESFGTELPQVFEGTIAEGVIPEPEPAFDPGAFEPVTSVEPFVEQVADIPRQVVPAPEAADLPAGAVPAPLALTEEQLRAAVLSASRETIERIVWEVVPDLAETMIQEAIRRITEAK